MNPPDSADDRPEDPQEEQDVVQADDAPPEDEPKPGGEQPKPGEAGPEVGDTTPSDSGGRDRAVRDTHSGFDFDYFAGLREMIIKSFLPTSGILDSLRRQQASWANVHRSRFPVGRADV